MNYLSDPSGVMVADETGFLKKGIRWRVMPILGTAGRIENRQLGVFLTHVSDKDLPGVCLPDKSWCADWARCAEAGIGEEVGFATKPELAGRMLERARDAGAVFDINYVLAISCDQRFHPDRSCARR